MQFTVFHFAGTNSAILNCVIKQTLVFLTQVTIRHFHYVSQVSA